jgi:hypothetical protein
MCSDHFLQWASRLDKLTDHFISSKVDNIFISRRKFPAL